MNDRSYSQNQEDTRVMACFPGDHVGSMLEIGAWMPAQFSNSRMFINNGWRAVLCELSPLPLDQLVRTYSDNPRVKVIGAAITPTGQHVKQFQITEDALSSSAPNARARWKDMRPDYSGGFYGNLWVPTIGLSDLLAQFFGDHVPDYVSIDTEGDSYALAIALMRTDHRPKALVVEHDGRTVEIMEVAKEYGYKAIDITQENMVLCR